MSLKKPTAHERRMDARIDEAVRALKRAAMSNDATLFDLLSAAGAYRDAVNALIEDGLKDRTCTGRHAVRAETRCILSKGHAGSCMFSQPGDPIIKGVVLP